MSTDHQIADITTAINELTGHDRLYDHLHQLIPEQGTPRESSIGSHTKHLAAPVPWNEPAAMLYLDIHAGAREHETNLTLLLWQRAAYRGGSDALTIDALKRLPDLIRAAHNAGHANRTIVTDATAAIISWPRLIRRLLDEARPSEIPWSKAPGQLHCPHCNKPLYLAPGWQFAATQADVICRNNTCRDDNGNGHRWEPSAWLGRLVDDTPEPDPTELRDPTKAITARDAPRVWEISTDLLYVWKHRGRITPIGTDPNGRDLYSNADIAALLTA